MSNWRQKNNIAALQLDGVTISSDVTIHKLQKILRAIGKKLCQACGEVKPLESFGAVGLSSASSGSRKSQCKKCDSLERNERFKRKCERDFALFNGGLATDMPDTQIIKIERNRMRYWERAKVTPKDGRCVSIQLEGRLKELMGGDNVAYFEAVWKDNKWIPQKRVPNQSW